MKNYVPFIPGDQDRQESQVAPFAETNGCFPFAAVHSVEIQEKILFGSDNYYSEQGLYVAAKVDPKKGSNADQIFTALKSVGLIKLSLLPEPVNFTIEQFTAPIDPKIMATGQDWLNQRIIETKSLIGDGKSVIPLSLAALYLNDFPPLITIDLNNGMNGLHTFHEVVLLNEQGDYFDSYGQLVKNIGNRQIYFVNKLKIKPKTMSNAIFVHKAGTGEYGWYTPKLSEDAMKDSALNMGVNILNAEGKVAFNQAKEMEIKGL